MRLIIILIVCFIATPVYSEIYEEIKLTRETVEFIEKYGYKAGNFSKPFYDLLLATDIGNTDVICDIECLLFLARFDALDNILQKEAKYSGLYFDTAAYKEWRNGLITGKHYLSYFDYVTTPR